MWYLKRLEVLVEKSEEMAEGLMKAKKLNLDITHENYRICRNNKEVDTLLL